MLIIIILGGLGYFIMFINDVPDAVDRIKKIYDPPNYKKCDQDDNIRGIILSKQKNLKPGLMKISVGISDQSGILAPIPFNYNNESLCFFPFQGLDRFCSLKYRISRDNRLLVSANIYDTNGCLVGKIDENLFVLNDSCQFTWNSDDFGFEVMDSDFDVVMTILFEPPDLIKVQGVINNLDKFVIIKDGGMSFIDKDSTEKLFLTKRKLQPVFEYLGEDWFGKRKTKPVPQI
ncbi:hypothetical protein ABN763_16110 [Spongiivirga sp. MCCC 1A20706]|uniref:hypothetical protein n=1 Tax=Spongiivirga sp. MCCC 1A20706 TaxID=3160963 RepID=UPI00397766DA